MSGFLLIVGLGNPGSDYEKTRHSVGFEVVGRLASAAGLLLKTKSFSSLYGKGQVEGHEVLLLLPQTFMNLSGQAVREAKDYYKVEAKDLLAVHDDLDLPLGRVKLDFNAGAAGHRGVESVVDHLGTKAFYRIRMGIGRPQKGREDVESFVLSRFTQEEGETAEQMIEASLKILRDWIKKEKVHE